MNQNFTQILLLDIDGVLIQPKGYREAVLATINTLCRQAQLTIPLPEEKDFSLCESLGITNEWDMIPIFLSSILEEILERITGLVLPDTLQEASDRIKSLRLHLDKIDYHHYIIVTGNTLKPGKSPSISVLERGLSGNQNHPFSRLAHQPLFASIFQNNKSIELSITTRVFQNYVLGDEIFRRTYQLEPQVSTSSFLKKFDKTLLSEKNLAKIYKLNMEGIINLVACTARPSLPSHMAHIAPVGFSPEAEMALEMMRWSDIPLVGYGRLVNIAQKISVSTDQLIKPSPFQALASILAAAARNEALGLGAAVKILQKRKLLPVEKQELLGENEETMQVTNFMAEMKSKKLLIHIVDDSPIGIQAGKQACSLLTGLTEGVEAKCWGVAQDQYKWRALEKVGAKVYQRSEETIRAILHEVDLARSL